MVTGSLQLPLEKVTDVRAYDLKAEAESHDTRVRQDHLQAQDAFGEALVEAGVSAGFNNDKDERFSVIRAVNRRTVTNSAKRATILDALPLSSSGQWEWGGESPEGVGAADKNTKIGVTKPSAVN